jgi:heterodisulfide reductase subunit A-like polyferredoxin
MSSNKAQNGTSAPTAIDEAREWYQKAAQQAAYPADTTGYKNTDPLAYEISRVPFRTSRRLKIICCGGGISGLNIAHEVETGAFANCSLTIYEKNSDLGGTWFENRYPGVA